MIAVTRSATSYVEVEVVLECSTLVNYCHVFTQITFDFVFHGHSLSVSNVTLFSAHPVRSSEIAAGGSGKLKRVS